MARKGSPGAGAGLDSELYIRVGGTRAAPVWLRLARVGDVTIGGEKNSAAFSSRESPTEKNTFGTLKIPLSLTYYRRQRFVDAVYNLLSDSHLNNTELDICAMDRPIAESGSLGIRGTYIVSKLERGEPINDTVSYSVELLESDSVDPDDNVTPISTSAYSIP